MPIVLLREKVSVVVTSLLTSSQETPNRPHPTKAPTQNKDEKNEGKRRRQKTKQQQEKINPGYKSISFVTHIDYSMSTDFSSLVSISKLSSTTLVENARDSTNMQESTDPVSPSALAEVLKHWRTSCLAHSKTPEDLCKDAKTFFGYLVRNTQHVTDNDVVLVTRSSHEEALAILIQELGVAFSSSKHMARVCALNVLAGALQGCSDSQLSNSITNLLGTFLLSHCGPIDVDEYGDDFDEQIRDAAVMGLTGLVCLPTSATANDDLVEAVKMRVTFAQQGVERRCAEPEEDEDVGYDHGFGRGGRSNDIRGGLSTLPRSKRSMCFDLVRSAVSGVAKISPPSIESALVIQPLLMEFATFSANCLQGESDPRCLLQLLQLLNALQLAFQPLFVSSKNAETVFPTSALFDAVAPYFPIQFTPPPNNIHGISRIGLHSALVSVLIYTSFDVNAKKHNRHSMLDLSAGLFLEQLLPLDPEEKPSVFDQLEAVECLTTLLFPIDFNGGSHCYQLEPATVRNMSQALIAIHNESSLAVAQGGEIGEHNKRLADTCRTFVSKVAFQLELATNKVLWETFVAEPLSKSASRLRTAPAASRTAIAYVACLAASGGSKTLRYCLGSCLDPLIEVVADKLEDRDNAAAAAHGIGAFFSSCRVAMDRAKKQGVALHPHPLEPYSAKAFQALYAAFDLLKEAMDEDGTSSLLVRIGTIRALESVLVASSSDQFEADDNQKICDLAQELLSAIMCSLSAAEAGDVEWKNACALTLGSLIGRSLDVVDNVEADSSESSSSVLATETIRTHMQATIYPELLASVTREVDTLEASRYDRKALALACKSSTTVAKKIVSSLLRSLSDALQQNKLDEASFCHADALSFVLRQGGDLAIQAYHDDSNSENIISKLSSLDTKLGVKENTNRISIIDNLVLPATMEEREASKIAVLTANKIIGFLLPAYQKFAPRISVQKMMHHVAKRIPPLSDSDNVSLCVRLPLLAAFLHGVIMDLPDQDDMEMEEAMDNKLTEITPALAEYVLSSDYESKARSAAASCLHATITSYSRGSNDCPAIKIVTDVINPSMKGAMGKFKAGDQSSVAAVKDCFNLFALVGSAAACRGGKSGVTADKIALFLVEVACTGKASPPFATEGEAMFDLSPLGSVVSINMENSSIMFEIAAASAYGSMLSIEGSSPFMKQRLTHVTLKYVRSTYEEELAQATFRHDIPPPRIGVLVIACHIICCSNITKIEKTTLYQIAAIAVEGLSSKVFSVDEGSRKSDLAPVKKLVLATILKLICVAPTAIGGKFTVVTGLLRAYASSDPSSEIACKLLALQALEGIANMEGAKQFTTSIKPAVVSIIAAAINHPSGLLRQAAVDVRNAWFLME